MKLTHIMLIFKLVVVVIVVVLVVAVVVVVVVGARRSELASSNCFIFDLTTTRILPSTRLRRNARHWV